MNLLLSADNLEFAYGPAQILRGVSVSLSAGEVVAIVGPNGSGKSTLIRTLLGELKRRSGIITWFDQSIDQWYRRELARKIAYLPQHPTAASQQTVADVLRLGRAPYWKAFGIESLEDQTIVRDVAGKLDLTDFLDRDMGDLSGGQQQRVFLGRCLAQRPAALLLDEPNTYLDLRHQVSLGRTIRSLAKSEGLGVIMASHDLNLASAFSDRMILLNAGKVAAEGSCASVLRSSALTEAFGLPMQIIERDGPPVVIPVIV